MIWSFARADQMTGHRFKDDVAITFALTKKQAIKKFSKLYSDIKPEEVRNRTRGLLRFGRVVILTDY